jgi:hypothetical protein
LSDIPLLFVRWDGGWVTIGKFFRRDYWTMIRTIRVESTPMIRRGAPRGKRSLPRGLVCIRRSITLTPAHDHFIDQLAVALPGGRSQALRKIIMEAIARRETKAPGAAEPCSPGAGRSSTDSNRSRPAMN